MNHGPCMYLVGCGLMRLGVRVTLGQRRHEEPWDGNGDPLREARGILRGVVISVVVWGVLVAIAMVLWRWL